jgi:hypothetical protein
MRDLLFDLDGTLLPMVQDEFANSYFMQLSKKFRGTGVDTDKLLKTIEKGLMGMVLNNGRNTNEEVFWQIFEREMKMKKVDIIDRFDEFYLNEFNEIITSTSPTGIAKEIIDIAKKKGLRLFLATNPLFPRQATLNRIRWAGLNPEDFLDITTYENSHFCKPNVKYFQEIIRRNDIDLDSALMIGNDVNEDLSISSLGVKTFLVTDCLENKHELELTSDFQGTLRDLKTFIIEL